MRREAALKVLREHGFGTKMPTDSGRFLRQIVPTHVLEVSRLSCHF